MEVPSFGRHFPERLKFLSYRPPCVPGPRAAPSVQLLESLGDRRGASLRAISLQKWQSDCNIIPTMTVASHRFALAIPLLMVFSAGWAYGDVNLFGLSNITIDPAYTFASHRFLYCYMSSIQYLPAESGEHDFPGRIPD